MPARRWITAIVAALVLPSSAAAQEPGVKFAIGDFGLGIGDVPRLDGFRLNFRDRHLERVRGVNATLWMPYQGARGQVYGLALGLPMTGAYDVEGVGLGLLGVGAEGDLSGIMLGGVGAGAGRNVRGLALGGVGVGAGGDLTGIMVGGVGAGAGGDVRGVLIGGVGAGGGGDMEGIGLGGVGIGASGDVTGIVVGGVGVGAGGTVRGLAVGGVGVGAGGGIEGIALGGVGVGSGGEIRGLALAITGVAVAGFGVGGEDLRGLMIAPAYFNVTRGGEFHGVSVSAWNRIQGRQHGLTIGILNVADELHGLQVGLINIARNKKSFSVLPLVNYSR